MHRTATFYDLKITARGLSRVEGNEADFEADPKSLLDFYNYISRLFEGGDRVLKKGRTEKSAKYYISDLSLKEGNFIILINRSDPKAPDPVSSEPESKSRVVHAKPPGHGGDFSAHVIIPIVPVKGDNYYLCVIETVYGSGLHASSIADYLSFVLRYCRLQFKEDFLVKNNNGACDSSGRPLMVRHIHRVELQGHPSSEFQQELKEGRLVGIELLDFSEKGASWDDKGAVFEEVRAVKLKPKKSVSEGLSTIVDKIRNKAAQEDEYSQVRVRFNNAKGEPRDATVDVVTGGLINEHKYVKRHNIDSSMVNTASLERINGIIVRQMINLMV